VRKIIGRRRGWRGTERQVPQNNARASSADAGRARPRTPEELACR
jgi:hypothetical protein